MGDSTRDADVDTDQAADRPVLDGKYELCEFAGEGGIGAVWRGLVHGAAGFARSVAIKQLRSEFQASERVIAMFVEEARVGSELQHPNIAQVHDFCRDEQGTYYLIMEWVDGVALSDFITARRVIAEPIPWGLVVGIGIGALHGLSAAHERVNANGSPAPVIHRDVSPQNILLGTNGVVKLTDFGLARAKDRTDQLSTAPGMIKGKIAYLAPEITKGAGASIASDLFAMGAVLWEALVGTPVFAAASDFEVLRRIRDNDREALDSARPNLPPALVQLVERALAPDPADRYSSAAHMAQDLAAVLSAEPGEVASQRALGIAVVAARSERGVRRCDAPTHSIISEICELSLSSVEIVPEGELDNPIMLTQRVQPVDESMVEHIIEAELSEAAVEAIEAEVTDAEASAAAPGAEVVEAELVQADLDAARAYEARDLGPRDDDDDEETRPLIPKISD